MAKKHNPIWWKKYYRKYKSKRREDFLQRKYGISIEEFDRKMEEQDGLCAICKQPPKTRKVKGGTAKRLCIDHDHKTGKIRSLLCANCNLVLGHLENNYELIPIMLQYITNHNA